MLLLIINGIIAMVVVWMASVVVIDAFTKRRANENEAIRQSHMPRWARRNPQNEAV